MKLIGNSGEIVEKKGNIVEKSIGTNTQERFSNQLNFLLNCTNENFIKIQKVNDQKYEMPFYKKTYFDFIKQSNRKENICKFEELLELVNDYSINNNGEVNGEDYIKKLESRVPIKFSFKNQIKFINNRGFNHGDLTFSNILLNNKNDFVLIDPRGLEESTYYDIGKIMQSIHMNYESLLYGEEPLKIYKEFEKIVRNKYDENIVDFYLGMHLIGAYPFLLKSNRVYSDTFLKEGLFLFYKLGINHEMTDTSLMKKFKI